MRDMMTDMMWAIGLAHLLVIVFVILAMPRWSEIYSSGEVL
jgi:hypothetical protein